MSEKYLVTIPEEHCAQAFITTDLDANQITAFHPGAMNHSHRIKVPANDGISIGVIAPDSREGMLQHAEQFKAANIPFIFDPGQAMPLFAGDDFKRFISHLGLAGGERLRVGPAAGAHRLERARTSCKHVKALIVTRGGEGSTIHADGRTYDIPCAKAREVLDPTGCGDAYRAGLIHGILRGLDWETTGRIASLMGAIKIAVRGTQNHTFHEGGIRGSVSRRFRRAAYVRPVRSNSGNEDRMSNSFPFTSESVSEGHPDKVADQISDAVLDAHSRAGQVLARRRRDAVQHRPRRAGG